LSGKTKKKQKNHESGAAKIHQHGNKNMIKNDTGERGRGGERGLSQKDLSCRRGLDLMEQAL